MADCTGEKGSGCCAAPNCLLNTAGGGVLGCSNEQLPEGLLEDKFHAGLLACAPGLGGFSPSSFAASRSSSSLIQLSV